MVVGVDVGMRGEFHDLCHFQVYPHCVSVAFVKPPRGREEIMVRNHVLISTRCLVDATPPALTNRTGWLDLVPPFHSQERINRLLPLED